MSAIIWAVAKTRPDARDGAAPGGDAHALAPSGPARLFDTALTIVLQRPWHFVRVAALCALGPAVVRTLVGIAVTSGGRVAGPGARGFVFAVDVTSALLSVGLTYAFASRSALVSLWEDDGFPRTPAGPALGVFAVWALPVLAAALLAWPIGAEVTDASWVAFVVWLILVQVPLLVSSLWLPAFPAAVAEPRSTRSTGLLRRSARLVRFGGMWGPYFAQLLCGIVAGVLALGVWIGADELRDHLPFGHTSVPSLVIAGLLAWLTTSIACAAAAGIPAATYLDTRIRREGLDIVLLLDELEAAG